MNAVKGHAWWSHNLKVTPFASAIRGMALGSLVGVLVAFPEFDNGELRRPFHYPPPVDRGP
jgi:hypothetical protein